MHDGGKKLKKIKDKAENSRGRKKYKLTQDYKSYADYAFTNNDTCHPRCENAADPVLCTPTNDEYQFTNWKYVLRKCTACTYISLPRVERDSLNQAPMITFNMYTTQFTCSHYGIIIRKKITTYLEAKVTSKKTCFLCEQLIQAKTPDFTRRRLYERVKPFSIQHKIGDINKYFYTQQIEKLSYHRSYYKILGKNHIADVSHKSFESTPVNIITRSYYSKQFSFEPNGQLENELFVINCTLSMEG